MKIFIFSLVFCFNASATGVNEYFHYKKGLSALSENQPQTALKEFLEALEADPLNSKIHFGLGLALLSMERPDQAVKAFSTARKLAKTKTEQFNAAFNAAVAAGLMENVDQALMFYQDALEIDPQSMEVKTNMELLVKSQNQQGGGGSQQNKDQNQNKDQQNKDQQNQDGDQDQKDQQPQQPKEPENKKAPKKFESQELTPNDVKKILEELKSQEQGIRAKEYEKGKKTQNRGKDW